jgi:hypothetical protein
MLFKSEIWDLVLAEIMKIWEENPKKDERDEKEATRVADTLVHIASRSLSTLVMGKAFVYALDGIISLYSCIRYVSFCTKFYCTCVKHLEVGCFEATLRCYESVVQGRTTEMQAIFIGKNRSSRWYPIGFPFRSLMVSALMSLRLSAAFIITTESLTT